MSASAANQLVVDTGTPPIPEARAWLTAYDGRAGAPMNLSQAAPGTPPPPSMMDRLAVAAADPTTTAYGPITGDADLTERYAAHIGEIYGSSISPGEIAITTGCNQAFFIALMAVAKAGASVLLPEPWYFNHQMTLQMLGIDAIPLPCHPQDAFVPDVEHARKLIRPDTRAIVLVTPNNPTGAIYSPAIIASFAKLAAETKCWLIVDETYRDFMDEAASRPHALFADASLRSHTIQLYSFSKSYAMPGHRLGALVAPRALMPEVTKILDCLQICAPRVGQKALVWAIDGLAEWREQNRRLILDRATAFRTAIATSNNPWSISSIGAYFAYVRHPYRATPAVDIARRLAIEAGVLVLPGTYFGGPAQTDHLRFAFANAERDDIAGIAQRLALIDR